jgi:3-deoxy-D-manno-octulosonic-acid transferase
VLERVGKKSEQIDEIRTQLENRIVLVAGSTHPTEEQYLVPAVADLLDDYPNLFVIWVLHDPETQALNSLKQLLDKHRLSVGRWSDNPDFRDLTGVVVDVTGILADLYSLGDIALVGGGFDKGVHSVIEPAAAGLPVLFGPRYHVSQEASYLIERGGGMVFRNRKELAEILYSMLGDENHRKSVGLKAKSVVMGNVGASERILGFLDGLVELDQDD